MRGFDWKISFSFYVREYRISVTVYWFFKFIVTIESLASSLLSANFGYNCMFFFGLLGAFLIVCLASSAYPEAFQLEFIDKSPVLNITRTTSSFNKLECLSVFSFEKRENYHLS